MKKISLILTTILIFSTSAQAATKNAHEKKIDACSAKVSKSVGYDVSSMLKFEKRSKREEASFRKKEKAFTEGMESCLKK